MADADEARLQVIGQIAVVRDRINKVEASLVREPVGSTTYPQDEIDNAIFQVGRLVGTLSRFSEAVRNPRKES